MVKKYQETANFVSGVLDVTELQNISPFMSKPQKFSVQRGFGAQRCRLSDFCE